MQTIFWEIIKIRSIFAIQSKDLKLRSKLNKSKILINLGSERRPESLRQLEVLDHRVLLALDLADVELEVALDERRGWTHPRLSLASTGNLNRLPLLAILDGNQVASLILLHDAHVHQVLHLGVQIGSHADLGVHVGQLLLQSCNLLEPLVDGVLLLLLPSLGLQNLDFASSAFSCGLHEVGADFFLHYSTNKQDG